jgi:uncharacterized DUF497 family protein
LSTGWRQANSHGHSNWDPAKARANRSKHRIGFEQACTVFRDPNALTIYDDEHADDEERWVTIGLSEQSTHLVVVHTFREESPQRGTIRIISARRANRREIRQYEGNE